MALAVALASWLAALLAFSLVGVLLRTGGWRTNRLLIGILTLEATLQLIIGTGEYLGDDNERGQLLFIPAILGLGALAWTYFVFVSRLDTPILRFARSRAARAVFALFSIGGGALVVVSALSAIARGEPLVDEGEDPWYVIVAVLSVFLSIILASLLALAGSIHAWRRAPTGTVARTRAAAFAIAFGARDIVLASALLASELNISRVLEAYGDAGFAIATILFIPLLTYGILRTQLFDLDLRVKVGIRRSTVVTAILVVALAAAKVAEFYLNRAFGWIAGGIAAGVMLVLTPRLNKMGEKVANTAMPQVQPTSTYVQFKKLEVYKAAVESAHETGGIDERQRAALDRLGSKLGLPAEDRLAVEAEVLGGPNI